MVERQTCLEINPKLCRGCARCIRRCPTEAMRANQGKVEVISTLCIGCGECMRVCPHKAIELSQDRWENLKKRDNVRMIAEPTFYVQVGEFNRTGFLQEALSRLGFKDIYDHFSVAYDVAAYAVAQQIREKAEKAEKMKKEEKTEKEEKAGKAEKMLKTPLISSYCPAVIRLIQISFPELTEHIVTVDSPIEIGVDYWRRLTGNTDEVALIAPCPAFTCFRAFPVGRAKSNIRYSLGIRQAVKELLSSGIKVGNLPNAMETQSRWLKWAACGGESQSVEVFSTRKINTLAISGLDNVRELLNEIELERLSGVDYVECRACYQGCIGGIAASESRFLSLSRLNNLNVSWFLAPYEMSVIKRIYEEGFWRMTEPIEPLPEQSPLSDDIQEAMQRLTRLRAIHKMLPGLDCGSCGRPSCHAMAEDIVRQHGELTDCIFTLKEKITELSDQIHELCRKKHATLVEPQK
jgi:iron only hydrogenase large subunit-like protein